MSASTRASADAIRKKLSQKSTMLSPFLCASRMLNKSVVCLVYLVCSVFLVCLTIRDLPDRPDRQDRPDRRLRQLLDSFGRADDVGEANAELLVHHDDFSPRHQLVVDQHFHRFSCQFFKLDHRPLPELQ